MDEEQNTNKKMHTMSDDHLMHTHEHDGKSHEGHDPIHHEGHDHAVEEGERHAHSGGDHAGHGGSHHDHHAHMVMDFRKRFWISLVLTIPILLISPMIQGFLGLEEVLRFQGDLMV